MKVVITHTDFRIYWPARLNALNNFLQERNIHLDIVEIANSGSNYEFSADSFLEPENWHCLFPGKKIEEINASLANKKLREKLDELFPDIIIAGAIAFPSGAGGSRWAVENKKKVIIFDDARLEDTPRSSYVNFIKKKIYTCIYAVFCPSHAWKRTYNYFGLKDKQLFYGVNVVNNSFWQNGESSNQLPEMPGGYFFTVGRQIPKKNYLFLLKAYNDYIGKIPNPVPLVLVGNGSERTHLENFIKANNLHSVHFLPFLSQRQLRDLYNRASCFILPSKYGESWGLVVNESMAAGLPVLVSDQSGCASTLVQNGLNGYTFPPDNIEILSGYLLKMHSLSITDSESMGLKSLEIINEWGLDRFCKGLYEAIQYVNEQELKKPDLLTRMILKIWKGRYRPV
jgi:1,2-diacylglycerol 3-alpha-glucosyltransferase